MQKCRRLQYFLERLKPYLPAKLNIGHFEVPPHLLLINIPTLTRRSIRWLAEVEKDRRGIVEKYFKEVMRDYYEVYLEFRGFRYMQTV
jgi:single-stranded DNA-specific DHH superfamily exonuclease